MIKVVFFDFDGVLTVDKTGSQTTTRYLSQATGVDPLRVQAAFARHNAALTLGTRTHASIWADICRDLETDLDIKLLNEAFASTPMNQPMLALARQLKLNYSVGMITDNKEDRIDCLKDLHGLGQVFHPIVVSASVGADKRDKQIFLHALGLVSAAPSECVLIDNSIRNLVVPRELGMEVIHFDDETNDVSALVRELQDRGVRISNA
jgi:putative hydrolase of the HAD superfamily